MEYRKLPKGNENISVLGLGMGGMENCPDEEITATIKKAIDNGINFFDMCCGAKNIFEPFGKAIKDNREKIYMQIHFGAVYGKNNEYAWSRDFNSIKSTVEWELKALNTNYIDFGFLHCIDEYEDFDALSKNGTFDYVKKLKEDGVIHHL